MFKNYLKIALRTLRKNKVYSLINLGGLAIGMACCLLIALYVRDELSYDQFHKNADRIYRVIAESGREQQRAFDSANSSFPIGPALRDAYPEVLETVRFREGSQSVLSYGQQNFAEKKFYFADPGVFEVFSFPLRSGNPKTALAQPNNVVLTASMAQKYFGEQDPIGKVLHYEGWAGPADLTVTGVLDDLPHNTQFDFDFLGSLLIVENEEFPWTWFTSLWTYVLLPEGFPPAQLEQKFPDFFERHIKPNLGDDESWFALGLEPLPRIHLHSQLDIQMKPTSNIVYVYLFSAIAVIILLMACINFTNLATAHSLKRAKEVGMRKALGGWRRSLVVQFLGESFVYCLLALAAAIAMTELAVPYFNQLTGKAIHIHYFSDSFILPLLMGVVAIAGILAGSYPAAIMSRFSPIAALKGKTNAQMPNRFGLRQGLVIFQFTMSIALMIGVIVIVSQLQYIRSKNLGANLDQVVVLPMSKSADAFTHELKQNPAVVDASASSRIPVNLESFDTRPVYIEGIEKPVQMENFNIDENFLATYKIEMIAGRNLSAQLASDSSAFLLNESAVHAFGWGPPENAIGKEIGWQFNYKKGRVVGVVKDFHMVSFRESIQPLILHKMKQSYWYNFLSVRLHGENLSETLAFVEKTWRKFNPKGGYEYFFADDSFAKIHRADARFGKIVELFTLMAIVISFLGLLGLAAYSAQQRTKEIGVRKVLGASVASVLTLLSKDFIKLVLLANLLAWPVAWFAMNRWLQNFAYRVEVGWLVFALAGGLALLIALLTVSTQAIRAALANPVDALHNE